MAMRPESAGSVNEPAKELGSAQQEVRTCPVCGTKFSVASDSDFCQVCILRGAASGDLQRPGKDLTGLATVRFAHVSYCAGVAGGGSGLASVKTSFISPVEASNTCRLGTILQ
jgi:hypothetical protein